MRVAPIIKLSSLQSNALIELAGNPRDLVLARRASAILECAKGLTNKEVSIAIGMNEADVGRWRKVYLAEGIDGLKGKNNGGANQYSRPSDDLDKRLNELLSQADVDWTQEKLVQALGSTSSIVGAALRRRNVNLQRQRQWKIQTHDELIPKTVDVVGIYLTHDEQAMIVCCSKTPIHNNQGEFLTRNRELFEDFSAYSGVISLADAINTAARRVGDASKLTPISLPTFLDNAFESYPNADDFEYHIIVSSAVTKSYRGVRLKNIYQSWTSDPSHWLQLVDQKINELGDRSQVNSVHDLKAALSLYLKNCIPTTAPMIWLKLVNTDESPVPDSQINSPVPDNKQEAFEEELTSVLCKYLDMEKLGSEQVKCGFISFVCDQDQISIRMDTRPESIIDVSGMRMETVEECTAGLTVIEQAILKTCNDAGIHAAEMTADFIKKKKLFLASRK